VFGAGTAEVLVFLGCALLGNLIAIGVLAFVGSLPWLVRPDVSGRPGHGARPLLGALLLVILFELTLVPAWLTWSWLQGMLSHDPTRLGEAAWNMLLTCLLTALPVFIMGTWLGSRNFARLLRPHR
jgi:hypothetical protein